MQKYLALISGFLQKEESCFLPGIGVLRVEKTSAIEEGDRILPPSAHVVFDSSATTARHHLPDEIKKYFQLSSEEANAEWKKIYNEIKKNAKPVTIPAIGELLQNANGNIVFSLFKENQFYAAVSLPERQQVEDIIDPYEENEKSGSILSWLLPVILLVLCVLGYFGYKYLSSPSENTNSEPSAVSPAADTALSSPAIADTATDAKITDSIHFAVIYKVYHSRESAEKHLQKMHNWGHDVSLYPRDSATFMLGYAFYELPADTAKRLEEVHKTYGGKPFIIYPGK